MTSNLYSPSVQYADENGKPYAGGKLYFYTQNTFTPKTVWSDLAASVPLTQPVVLDSSGRAVVYGAGIYRVVLQDSSGNQIFDSTVEAYLADSTISAAMLPVVGAATLAQARTLMGIDAEIQAAINTVNAIPGPTGPAGPVSTVPGPQGATGPTGPASSLGNVQGGLVTCTGGHGHVDFSPAYSAIKTFQCTVAGNAYVSITYCANVTNSSADIYCTYGGSGTPATVAVWWAAYGT